MTDTAIPEGFDLLESKSPFNLMIGPLHCRVDEDGFVIGLLVEPRHCNSAGHLHGAMISAICDFAIGHNVGLSLAGPNATEVKGAPRAPIATVSLSTDYVGTARAGDWVACHVDVQRTGRSLAFANAYVHCQGERIARANAIFKIMRPQEQTN